MTATRTAELEGISCPACGDSAPPSVLSLAAAAAQHLPARWAGLLLVPQPPPQGMAAQPTASTTPPGPCCSHSWPGSSGPSRHTPTAGWPSGLRCPLGGLCPFLLLKVTPPQSPECQDRGMRTTTPSFSLHVGLQPSPCAEAQSTLRCPLGAEQATAPFSAVLPGPRLFSGVPVSTSWCSGSPHSPRGVHPAGSGEWGPWAPRMAFVAGAHRMCPCAQVRAGPNGTCQLCNSGRAGDRACRSLPPGCRAATQVLALTGQAPRDHAQGLTHARQALYH